MMDLVDDKSLAYDPMTHRRKMIELIRSITAEIGDRLPYNNAPGFIVPTIPGRSITAHPRRHRALGATVRTGGSGMSVRTKLWSWWMVTGVMVALAACGGPDQATVSLESEQRGEASLDCGPDEFISGDRCVRRTTTTTTTVAPPPDPWEEAFAPLGLPAPGPAEQAAVETLCTAGLLDLAETLAGDQRVIDATRAGFSVACPEKISTLDASIEPFGPGYPREVPLAGLPPGPQNFISGQRPGSTTAVEVAPGVWTPRGLSTTPMQDALEGGFYGYCSDIAALESRLGVERGGACW